MHAASEDRFKNGDISSHQAEKLRVITNNEVYEEGDEIIQLSRHQIMGLDSRSGYETISKLRKSANGPDGKFF